MDRTALLLEIVLVYGKVGHGDVERWRRILLLLNFLDLQFLLLVGDDRG